ncbi:NAC domain-containing protein 104-like [Cucurbita pepo subsp. pepo]|uniref:NAC domain-containing protein 104-like n=1 Tax=Cucurbita pepo subsp. pepo TaxID=3664 RepID=UPI000C9D6CD6|nr:NAC domain-containing protein 104-like [Cucurbita pepo subsp. pepo]
MEASSENRFNLLPPGLRFCPTDEDLVLHFLYHKASLASPHHSSNSIIPQLQLHLYNPWQFHGRALSNGDIHYFFSTVGESKATENGYWKDVLMDEPILCSATGDEVGIKKYHIFFVGEGDDSPTPIQTTWVMQEYRIYSYLLDTHAHSPDTLPKQESEFGLWVMCRVFEAKDNSTRSIFSYEDDEDNESELSYLDEMYLSIDDI